MYPGDRRRIRPVDEIGGNGLTVDSTQHKEASKTQQYRMLEDIARELAGDVVFPTYFDVAVHIRTVLRQPEVALADVVRVVELEPLICAKLLRLANSVAYNPAGMEVVDVGHAVTRLGFDLVRTTALAFAMDQLRCSHDMLVFDNLSRAIWEHSLLAAAAARVVARRMTPLNPDEAMLAGLIHDLGAFYMLYRAAQYPDMRSDPDLVRRLLLAWHESIGESLLFALGLPEEIIAAVREHDQPRVGLHSPKTLADVIYMANLLAGGCRHWAGEDFFDDDSRPVLNRDHAQDLLDEIEAMRQELLGVFSGSV